MKKGTIKISILLILGLTSLAINAMDDEGFRTPPRPPHKRVCPSSEDRDPTFRPGPTPESERKRSRVEPTCISSPCVRRWPGLLCRRQLSQSFLVGLATAELKDGTTMLHKAMKQIPTHGTVSCIVDMIQAGADLTAKQIPDGDTPLHRWVMCPASSQTEIAVVSSALQHRPCPHVDHLKNNNGSTPLHLLCSRGLLNHAKFQALVEWGIPLDAQNQRGQTILHRLAQTGTGTEEKAGILALLGEHDLRAFVNKRDWHGRTALYCAVQAGDIPVFEFLAKITEVGLDLPDNDENTALHAAARNVGVRNRKAAHFIKRLVELGASKEAENEAYIHPRDLVSDRYHQLKQTLS